MGLQSGMIEFEVDQTQLQRIELKLKDMKAKAPQALKNAVNATARDAKKDLADKAKETFLAERQTGFSPSEVNGLYLNIRYEDRLLSCVTGTSVSRFTLDKTLEHKWDGAVKEFLKEKRIPFEEK